MVYLTFGRGAAICPPEIARKEGEMIAITTCTQIRLRMLDMAGPFGFESSIKNARPGRVLPPFVAPSCRAARQCHASFWTVVSVLVQMLLFAPMIVELTTPALAVAGFRR